MAVETGHLRRTAASSIVFQQVVDVLVPLVHIIEHLIGRVSEISEGVRFYEICQSIPGVVLPNHRCIEFFIQGVSAGK